MANKVLISYVLADIVFAITGALVLGFSIINQNTVNDAPKDGTEAASKLLTKQFPLNGTCRKQEEAVILSWTQVDSRHRSELTSNSWYCERRLHLHYLPVHHPRHDYARARLAQALRLPRYLLRPLQSHRRYLPLGSDPHDQSRLWQTLGFLGHQHPRAHADCRK